MRPRLIILGFSACFVGFTWPTPAAAQHRTTADASAGIGWSYYGLGGGPYINYHPWAFRHHFSGPPVASYGPVPGVDTSFPRRHHWVPPYHAGFGYGWAGYYTPSPRPRPSSVSVSPSSPVAGITASESNSCLRVAVKLPDATAIVWFDETATTTAGADRVFESPPLTPGQRYTYTITAIWTENGKERKESKSVTGQSGETLAADFTK